VTHTLAIVTTELAAEALGDPVVKRLMTIPGVDAIAAISVVAAVGDFTRFSDPHKLVAYFGLNPKVRQSGNSAPVHGRISKAGRGHIRGILVEAAWSASRAPGPLRAFFARIKARRGFPIAVVATARKMTVLAWHLVAKGQDYAFARQGWSPTNNASSSSPTAPHHGGATSAPRVRPTTTSNAAAPRPPRSSRPNEPTKSSSATGSLADQPLTRAGLDDFIRRADHLADLGVEDQERHAWPSVGGVAPPVRGRSSLDLVHVRLRTVPADVGPRADAATGSARRAGGLPARRGAPEQPSASGARPLREQLVGPEWIVPQVRASVERDEIVGILHDSANRRSPIVADWSCGREYVPNLRVDWPVEEVGAHIGEGSGVSYAQWVDLARAFLAALHDDEIRRAG
jgi:hypothetical protein